MSKHAADERTDDHPQEVRARVGDDSVIVTPLGGVGRFGRNCLLLEVPDGDAVVIDCGVRFLHESEAPGFELALPDLARLRALGSRLKGYLVTHGHEDHVGALPFAFDGAPARLITLPFTSDVIERRFARTGRTAPAIEIVEPGVEIAVGTFVVRFVNVSHAIPDSSALVVDTPAGRVVHSGDFRIDLAPLAGPPTDLDALSTLGPVRLLLADSTGALSSGASPGEASVTGPLTDAIRDAPALVIVGTYGSHFQRVKSVAEAARITGRKLVVLGPSVRDTVAAARRRGLVDFDDVLAPLSALESLSRHHLVVVAPGCQGEEASTLARVARGDHPRLVVEKGDRVILSARTIPGNELAVGALTDAFAHRGVVVMSGENGRHVSGHGARDELVDLLTRTAPDLFVALHGSERHLAAHRAIAAELIGENAVIALSDGETLTLTSRTHTVDRTEALSTPFVQGREVVVEPERIVAARQRMMQAGVLVVRRAPAAVSGRGLLPALLSVGLVTEIVGSIEKLANEGDDVVRDRVIEIVLRRCRQSGVRAPEVVVV
jgi:ribonuclease J